MFDTVHLADLVPASVASMAHVRECAKRLPPTQNPHRQDGEVDSPDLRRPRLRRRAPGDAARD
jgi:hypothetical protein